VLLAVVVGAVLAVLLLCPRPPDGARRGGHFGVPRPPRSRLHRQPPSCRPRVGIPGRPRRRRHGRIDSRRTHQHAGGSPRSQDAEGLAEVSCADAVIAVPLGVAVDRRHLADLHVVLLGAAVALLTDVIISGRLFSILTSNKPAAGAALGLIFLDQRIIAWQWAGIAADAVAAVGAARGSRQRSTTAVMTVAQTRRELTQTPSQHRSASRSLCGTHTRWLEVERSGPRRVRLMGVKTVG